MNIEYALASINGVVKAGPEVGPFLKRAAANHLKYAKPGAEMAPTIYAGKVETSITTLLLDIAGVSAGDIQDPIAFFRAGNGFNLQWRAYDEVLDEVKYTTDPVTEDDLDTTPVLHKYARHLVVGREGSQIVLDETAKLIQGQDAHSRRRKDRVEALLDAYRKRVADTANNPLYHGGEVLPFPIALQSKQDITGFLAETGVAMQAALIDIPQDHVTVEGSMQLGIALQFGDDLLDWRKDWRDQIARRTAGAENLRPGENLLNATLEEYPDEKAACEVILFDDSRRHYEWIRDIAPNALNVFRHRFYQLVDQVPEKPRLQAAKDIVVVTFEKLLTVAPDRGRFYDWAKY